MILKCYECWGGIRYQGILDPPCPVCRGKLFDPQLWLWFLAAGEWIYETKWDKRPRNVRKAA